jgi:hypothetical protein
MALAGRRIDAADAEIKRFPLENVETVRNRIKDFFDLHHPSVLICSGASGSDLIALDIAGELQVQRHMVLPFPPDIFKEKSVADSPGNWAPLFDRIYKEISDTGNVSILNYAQDDEDRYAKTNIVILDMTKRPAEADEKNSHKPLALAVWDGQARSGTDMTAHFMEEAKKRNIDTVVISSL